ncbi:hypothetical protein CS8_065600 [Cupriavidus sp. 8B]
MTATFPRTITEADIVLFAAVSGDNKAVHINEEFARTTQFKGRIAHGMLTASVISAAIIAAASLRTRNDPIQRETNMTTETNPFADVTKMIQQFKIPGLDMSPIIESRRKDMEALAESNKVAYEAMQAMAQKQTEILTRTMQGIQDFAKAQAGGAGSIDPAKQADMIGVAYQTALTDMKDLAEMARRSQVDALATITQRATQHMEEMKKLMQPK